MVSADAAPELRHIGALDSARRERGPGARLSAMRAAARKLRDSLRVAGAVHSVRTFDLFTSPYPTRLALQGAAAVPIPLVMLRSRALLVQVRSGAGIVNVLINPTDPDRRLDAPVVRRLTDRVGEVLGRQLRGRIHQPLITQLRRLGIGPEDIHLLVFDSLHGRDLRRLLGTDRPEPGEQSPTPALFPKARAVIQTGELDALTELHPLQREWYLEGSLRGVPTDKIVGIDGDFELGPGLSVIKTPGYSRGHQTIALVTDSGLWTVSSNGVAVDNYAPGASAIPGVRAHARDADVEVILAGASEDALAQYTSMVVERTLADRCPRRPEFPLHLPTAELVKSWLTPGLAPTMTHGGIESGTPMSSRTGGHCGAAA